MSTAAVVVLENRRDVAAVVRIGMKKEQTTVCLDVLFVNETGDGVDLSSTVACVGRQLG
jgi:hypothetical protein